MCSVKEQAFLQDIGEAARRIQSYTTGMSYEAFLNDTKTQDAVVRNLEILGEATKQLSDPYDNRLRRFPGAILRVCVTHSSITISASISISCGRSFKTISLH